MTLFQITLGCLFAFVLKQQTKFSESQKAKSNRDKPKRPYLFGKTTTRPHSFGFLFLVLGLADDLSRCGFRLPPLKLQHVPRAKKLCFLHTMSKE